MAIENPTFNLKTGADSDLIISREVTKSGTTIGKIKRKDGIFRFPYLARRTGDTISGTTENIESSELKHGRTKSAPRKGTSSSSGDISFELSPETFDDMLEAVFRGEWKRWESDTESPSNKDKNQYQAGYFATKCATGDTKKGGKKLIYTGPIANDADPNTEGLVHCKDNGQGFIIHELNSETNDVKYSIMRKYGGQKNEDLWQEFCHCALNTMQLQVEINSIITGSFGVMGTNNPKIFDDKEVTFDLENRLESVDNAEKLDNKGEWVPSTAYAVNDAVYIPAEKQWYKCVTATAGSAEFDTTEKAHWSVFESHEFVGAIPEKATDTMQFTAREGFLYINGRKIQYAQSLSFSLDNGLTPKYAIFVPNAISVPPLTLNISGDLSTYLVNDKNGSKELFNDAINDETIELLFCFQDKLEDPTALYVFQIFKAKHTENNVSGNGADTFSVSLPWSSFDEQACRVFRIMLPRVTDGKPIGTAAFGGTVVDGVANAVQFTPNMLLNKEDIDPSKIEVTVTVDGEVWNGADPTVPIYDTLTLTGQTKSAGGVVSVDDATANIIFGNLEDEDDFGCLTLNVPVEQGAEEKIVGVTVKWNEYEYYKSYKIPAL